MVVGGAMMEMERASRGEVERPAELRGHPRERGEGRGALLAAVDGCWWVDAGVTAGPPLSSEGMDGVAGWLLRGCSGHAITPLDGAVEAVEAVVVVEVAVGVVLIIWMVLGCGEMRKRREEGGGHAASQCDRGSSE
jgi:hypothetical protein